MHPDSHCGFEPLQRSICLAEFCVVQLKTMAKAYPEIWLPSRTDKGIEQHALVYFICGNPGLIEYYTDFLSHIRGLLDATESRTAYDVYGRNLLGFSDDDHEPFGKGNEPWDLDGQIEGIY